MPFFLISKVYKLVSNSAGRCYHMISRDEAQERVSPIKLIRFTKAEEKATFRCPDCGQTLTMKYRNYLKHPYCRICGNITTPPRTNKEFKEDVAALVGNEYALVGDYVNSRKKVTLYHKKCGKTFTVAPVDFFQGTRCPYCTDNKYMAKRISNSSFMIFL